MKRVKSGTAHVRAHKLFDRKPTRRICDGESEAGTIRHFKKLITGFMVLDVHALDDMRSARSRRLAMGSQCLPEIQLAPDRSRISSIRCNADGKMRVKQAAVPNAVWRKGE